MKKVFPLGRLTAPVLNMLFIASACSNEGSSESDPTKDASVNSLANDDPNDADPDGESLIQPANEEEVTNDETSVLPSNSTLFKSFENWHKYTTTNTTFFYFYLS